MGLVALRHGMWDLGSPARDQTHVPCIGRQILSHWTTREEESLPSVHTLIPKALVGEVWLFTGCVSRV